MRAVRSTTLYEDGCWETKKAPGAKRGSCLNENIKLNVSHVDMQGCIRSEMRIFGKVKAAPTEENNDEYWLRWFVHIQRQPIGL